MLLFKNFKSMALAVALTAVSASHLTAFAEGGSSSNGSGGTVSASDHMIPFGFIGNLIANSMGPDYAEELANFRENFPKAPITNCKSDNPKWAYPELPEALKNKIQISLLEHRTFFSDRAHSFSADQLCSSTDWIQSYGQLMILLHAMVEGDEVGMYLIDQTVAKNGQAIEIVIAERPTTLPAKGESIVEFSWFDHENGKIYWAPRPQERGFAGVLGIRRSPQEVLRHEIAHALIQRSWRGVYPREKYWHDMRYIQAAIDHFSNQDWILTKTSNQAAFIEGLASALERTDYAGNNPRVLSRGNFNSVYAGSDGNCYWQPEAFQTRNPITLNDNEIYVGSSINSFFDSYAPDTKDLSRMTIFTVSSHTRMKSMIQAIASESPSSVEELAKAYEQITHDGLGEAWLREFYLQDFHGSNVLGGLLESKLIEATIFRGARLTWCVRPGNESLFFSLKMDSILKKERSEAEARFAGLVQAQYQEKLRAFGEQSRNMIKSLQDYYGSAEEALQARQRFSQKSGFCPAPVEQTKELEQSRFNAVSDLQDQLYPLVVKKHGLLSMVSLIEFIQTDCQATEIKPFVEAEASLRSIDQLVQAWPTQPADQRDAVLQGEKLKSQLSSSLSDLRNELIYAQVVSSL